MGEDASFHIFQRSHLHVPPQLVPFRDQGNAPYWYSVFGKPRFVCVDVPLMFYVEVRPGANGFRNASDFDGYKNSDVIRSRGMVKIVSFTTVAIQLTC